MMVMLAAFAQPIYGIAEMLSRDFSIVSVSPRSANGGRHITVTAFTLHPVPPSPVAPPGDPETTFTLAD